MRTLVVLRHAKSDWETGVDDHARPLAKRGRKASTRVGRYLALAGPRPDIVVTSTATRAKTTAERVLKAAGWSDVAVHATDALYGASVGGAVDVVRALPDEAGVGMIVGHEPTLSDLVGGLVGGSAVAMATGTLAVVSFDAATWREVELGTGLLERLVPARTLEGLGLRRTLERKGATSSTEEDRQ